MQLGGCGSTVCLLFGRLGEYTAVILLAVPLQEGGCGNEMVQSGEYIHVHSLDLSTQPKLTVTVTRVRTCTIGELNHSQSSLVDAALGLGRGSILKLLVYCRAYDDN